MNTVNTIQYTRGDTYPVSIAVINQATGESYIPQVGDTITMTVRASDYRGAIVIQKKTGDADVTATETGWTIILQPSDTSALLYKKYVYDVQLDMSGVVKTVIPMSLFILDKEVTY